MAFQAQTIYYLALFRKSLLTLFIGDEIDAGGATGTVWSKWKPKVRQRRKGETQEVFRSENLVSDSAGHREESKTAHRVLGRLSRCTGRSSEGRGASPWRSPAECRVNGPGSGTDVRFKSGPVFIVPC